MRVLCFALMLAGLTLVPVRPVRADTREEARRAFAAGQAADDAKDYRGAIELYLRAYELAPHHFALFNIATDYERLGELRESAEWFNRYLREAPPSPELDRVQRLIVELKLRPAKLTVTTKPVGARVFVDGQYVGRTPFTKPVKGGGRRVAVDLNGQHDERDVFLEFGEPKSVEFSLQTVAPSSGPTGSLEIAGGPEGARVEVDDQMVGTLPAARADVIPGEHTIKVTHYGYAPFETTATVKINEPTRVPVAMVRDGDASAAPGSPTVISAGYLLGAGGGVDLRSGSRILLGEFGIRVRKSDWAIRIGKAGDLTTVDIVFRYALLPARLSPYMGVGYSYAVNKDASTGSSSSSTGSSGAEVVGGLRFDLARGAAAGASVLVEAGLRYHADVAGPMGTTQSGILIPLMASLQYVYGRSR